MCSSDLATLRWPSSPSALYRAISGVLNDAKEDSSSEANDAVDAAIDAKAFAELV